MLNTPHHDALYRLNPFMIPDQVLKVGVESSSMSVLNASLEALTVDQFYARRGIKQAERLTAPLLFNAETFELPRNALMHYIPVSDTELGPVPTHFFLRNAKSQILAGHVTELTHKEGNPIRNMENPIVLGNKYKNQYRRIRPMRDLVVGCRDENVVVIENYCLLNHLYRYRPTPFTRTARFNNLINTVVDTLNKVSEQTSREQFLELRVPRVLPTRPQFVRGEAPLTRTTMTYFPDDDSLLLLELWKWIGENRQASAFSRLSEKALKSLNFVVIESGVYTVFNLGRIDSWRKVKLEDGTYTKGILPQQLQLRFAKFLEALFTMRTAATKTIVEQQVDDTDPEATPETTAVVKEGEELEEIKLMVEQAQTIEDSVQDVVTPVPAIDPAGTVEPPQDSADLAHVSPIMEIASNLRGDGLLSSAEERRIVHLATSYTRIPNPVGPGTLEDLMKIDDAVLNSVPLTELKDIPLVVDKSMLKTTLVQFDPVYIEKVLHADIARMVMQAQQVGVAITDYKIDRVEDAGNGYEIHTVRLTPTHGAPSTFRFRVPIVGPDGVFLANNVKLRLRKQRGDLPIRKVSPTRVAMTSYYSKLFVNRSQRKVDDYGTWLLNNLMLLCQADDSKLTNVVYVRAFKHTEWQPRHFSILATRFKSFDVAGIQFMFDIAEWRNQLGDEALLLRQNAGEIPCGRLKGKLVIMSESGSIYLDGEESETATTIEELLGIDVAKAPIDVVDLTFMGKNIPMGIVLGYYFGVSTLLRMLKVQYRVVARGTRADLQSDEFLVRFADIALVLSRHDKLAAMLFAGFNAYHKSVTVYEFDEYNRPDVYGSVLDRQGLGNRYVKELDNMKALFIDPITKGLLERMNEPTTFPELLIRATTLLLNDYHPEEIDGRYRREKGYERIAGHVYSELAKGLRRYKARPVTARAQVDIPPNAVWAELQGDASVTGIEESNPIHNLKEKENLTFGGTGGRSSRSLVRSTRAFHPNDLGVVSEATVDSSDVAVTTFLSANPRLTTLRGEHSAEPIDFTDVTQLLSTSALLSPAATMDDAKRVNFISIQQSHVVAAAGYSPSPLRTGYEMVLAHRVDDIFAATAKADGVVTEVTEESITIKYDDPELPLLKVAIGRYYGIVSGTTVPHDIVTDLVVGDRVSKDHVVVWNSGFFERDIIQPTQVVWKAGVMVRTALMETPDTHEDSSAISQDLSKRLEMNTTEVRELLVNFKQDVRNLAGVGQVLDADSILCNIIDTLSSGDGAFDDATVDTLSALARNSPRSKVDGVIGKIEVVYNGDLEDMSETLREIAMAADQRRAKRARRLKKGVTTGYVRDLEMDTMLIKIYIDSTLGAADGDKGVFGNQMKSVIGRVMSGRNETESGDALDAIFSYSSTNNRIVLSPDVMGTTNVLLRLATERAIKAYRGS